ncbi:diguanylate cyclase [Frankia sp. AgB1.9]|uniref:diguanylate cyclase n=1 Tax=unclassified Frankia TaxID=2632575 RepID=UPI00193189AF|nr:MULTISPECIES: diguanylate cyclase [unclassified Frankia]MBL7488755.1 diguanylate cyclase [Frankia sp. AgW1.1]MBL7546564.1 diguanylate cyclase [Frankia sp. AgB1.9]MBL7625066.1 diguanylate cyclase [Frankia sp. AgB1.8]
MAADRMSPGRDPPAATSAARPALLHATERTRITRLVLPTGPVIRKEPLGPDAQRRLRHELDILERLAGIDGVAQLAAEPTAYADSILLEDVNGVELAQRETPLDPDELIDLAHALAHTAGAVHHRGVVHRDICPANIVVSADDGTPYLIDFTLATTLSAFRPELAHQGATVGTVAYLAPEQTGRTGRPVDQRADLYALGATLYELATGAPPFGVHDPIRIIHDHLTRIPVSPRTVNPFVPASLSEIIMHLLEKEPDDRYQSADGLEHDLALARGGAVAVRPGEHDLLVRPLAPSRLSGREGELGSLRVAFAEAVAGESPGVLVSGAPGVGKTSLVDALRPVVAGADGWFVAGKFDQYRRDQDFDGVRQGLRALGRLLLAEPEDRLATVRARMLQGLGPNAGLVTATVPELAALLKVPPDPGDPMTAQTRLSRMPIEMLRAVASPARPVVFFVDDLQWAGRTPLGFIDLMFTEERIPGLLLVAAYRGNDVDATCPLLPLLARWREQRSGPHDLCLDTLSPIGQAAMIADMLRLAAEPAARLARATAPTTGGNPYDLVQLLTLLRREGILTTAATAVGGWRWDGGMLRRRLDQVEVTAPVADRVAALPADTAELLAVMASLAGQVDLDLLVAAAGLPKDEVERRLAPAFADGLLVRQWDERPGVRFNHDRTRESVLAGRPARERRARWLCLARRLAGRPEFCAVAAEQYLPVVDAVRGAEERRVVVALFRRAAEEAKLLSNQPLMERLLSAAVTLVDADDNEMLIELDTQLHAALFSLGRLEDADRLYEAICRLCTRPDQLTPATMVQVTSLTNRARAGEAIGLGLGQLRRLGMSVPDDSELDAEIDQGLDELGRWIDTTSEADDLRRPEITDQSRLRTIKLVNRVMVATFFHDQTMMAWLTVRTLKIWKRHGPNGGLVGPASHIPIVTITRRGDFHTGPRILRRILSVCQARGYEPDVWQALFIYVATSGHWFEPLEENVANGRRALGGLLRGGDLQNACWAHYALVCDLLDCAPSLEAFAEAVDEGLAFAVRTGNGHAEGIFRAYSQMVLMLRGEVPASVGDDAAGLSVLATDPFSLAHLHVARAVAAVVLDHPADVARHAAAVLTCGSAIVTNYPVAVARVLLGISLAARVRSAGAGQADGLLAELDGLIEWLAARAADAPDNFLHLLRLMEAKRAWAVGDFQAAAYAFDVALREVSVRSRPWHRALILESVARFYLAHGMEEAGYALLWAARRQYLSWGATAKVSQLDWAHPAMRTATSPEAVTTAPEPIGSLLEPRPGGRATVATGAVDLLAVVNASQALSSETSIDGLQAKVVRILSEMTGATDVHLLLREHEQEERQEEELGPGMEADLGQDGWLVATGASGRIPLAEAGRQHRLPLSVVRYAARTHEPVLVANAARDDRFARDPYFAGLSRCSLLAIPIMIRRSFRAMLLLENRMIRGAFSAERLEGIMIIAGQLAVSLDNAMVYASLERKVADRTRQLAETNRQLTAANRQLEQFSITDPLTGLANRRRLEDVLAAEWHRAGQHRATLALAMIDIDHFKLYNDHFGHVAGDRCLRQVATCLADNVGEALLAARYGGEEFTVVMPDTDLADATRLAQRLCRAVEDLAEPHPLTTEHVVTVSIGVTAVRPAADAAAEAAGASGLAAFVKSADVALYRAKHSGRNHVEAAAP